MIDINALKNQVNLFLQRHWGTTLEEFTNAAELTGKWIPVNEKLPKDPKPVLVTILWHEPYDNYEVSIGEYWDNGEGWDWLGAEIVAWMPLPEPYKKDDKV